VFIDEHARIYSLPDVIYSRADINIIQILYIVRPTLTLLTRYYI
jgi:hypothetical protein